MITPLHIQIGIHYHTNTVEDFPHYDFAPAVRDYVHDFVAAGLLRARCKGDGPAQAGFTAGQFVATDGLKIWIEALCAIPFPVQAWVILKRQGDDD